MPVGPYCYSVYEKTPPPIGKPKRDKSKSKAQRAARRRNR